MPNASPERRYEQRKRYYKKHREHPFIIPRRRLTKNDLILIREHLCRDVTLSKILQRSVFAIQAARNKIKNGFYDDILDI